MPNRLAQLRALLEATPDDAFLGYALATELYRSGDHAAGIAAFEALRARHPDYVGLYYHLGAALAERGQREAADAVFADGIARARRLGDRHALAELQNIRLNVGLEN